MYAGDRSAANTLKQANEIAVSINFSWVGVAVDVYHPCWDPDLKREIQRCAAYQYLFAFYVCDWKVPTLDFLNDRGLMGAGCINIPQIRGWVEEIGFIGYNEVEVFSDIYWAGNQQEYLKLIKEAYLTRI